MSHRADQQHHAPSNHQNPTFVSPDLADIKSSSSNHLRTLSKFAKTDSSDDFSFTSPAPSVTGLSGRRQLKRLGSVRGSRESGASNLKKTSTWAENNWMEKQRQFLQAYEYLCHIGEAKEWIEDITHQPVPPIVQLEEALRDGVILAEVIQAFYPDQHIRIFRHHKLQFRHSDNIAVFFQFLADMELPELFRFELVDLYEKKNIPKAIYCIHALSWLLFRKGLVDFRIGNLVGQLEFEHHELEEMQKGLDKAGVSMPSFAGMGASFGVEPEPEVEPEPIETEDERIARELGEQDATIADFQSQARGALERLRLGDMMQRLWDAESSLGDLQAFIRGDWAREVAEYRNMTRLCTVKVQSAARGYLERTRQQRNETRLENAESDIQMLQSILRATITRREVTVTKNSLEDSTRGVQNLQAAIRGALQRKRVDEQWEETSKASASFESLQAIVRGMLLRRALQRDRSTLHTASSKVIQFQSAFRAMAKRQAIAAQNQSFKEVEQKSRQLQSVCRAFLVRRDVQGTKREFQSEGLSITYLQAVVRAQTVRKGIFRIQELLLGANTPITSLQARIRGLLQRQKLSKFVRDLHNAGDVTRSLQSYARGALQRQVCQSLLDDLESYELEISKLQALSRAMLIRRDVGDLLTQLDDEESNVIQLQAIFRGNAVRTAFAEKQRYFKSNMDRVIKVQSFVRGRMQGESYKSLTTGANPPVGTVKNFVHLLNDSDFDFDEEVEFERLRKTVVQHVRQNEMADQYISQLDIKIALLVKNKITLDEVVKHQKQHGGAAGSLLSNKEVLSKDPFDLKALNKNSRKKLEHYQELFFILQTQSQYLARLFRRLREQATAEKECDRIRHLTMGLFGFAQKRREEYYLVKLITRSLKEEVENCSSLQDFLRGNFFWVKLFSAYAKSPRDRKYMRDMLGPIIKESIIENPELDLESDPMQIYLSAIENEQLRTGQRSQRNPDIPREAAIRDPETKRTFIGHLQDLRDIADQTFMALDDHLQKMPFGVRYVAQQMYRSLVTKFPHNEPNHILQLVGHWVWKNYLHPGFTEPEKFGVIDRGLSQEHRRNIGEVSKVVGQVAAGRLFGAENVFLQPLNSYVGESIERLAETWSHRKTLTLPIDI